MASSSDSFPEDKFLGKGAYGSVYLHYDKRTTALVAVKRIDVGPAESEDADVTKELKAVRKEISMMKDLNHKRIVQYIRAEGESNIFSIYMEYVSGGSLAGELIKMGPLSEDATRKNTLQLLEGLSYLHCREIIHRDVKGSNILCDGRGNIKLADFGISRQMNQLHTLTSKASKNTSKKGTVYWMAPEVIKAVKYGRRADIWSTGATVVEMLTTRPPWYGLEDFQAMFKIGSLEKGGYALDSTISRDAEDFLTQTFMVEELRPRADELLQHSWLKAVYVIESEGKTDSEAVDFLSDVQKNEASVNVERATLTELDVQTKVMKDEATNVDMKILVRNMAEMEERLKDIEHEQYHKVLENEEKTDSEAEYSPTDVQKHEASANVEMTTPAKLDVRTKVVKDEPSNVEIQMLTIKMAQLEEKLRLKDIEYEQTHRGLEMLARQVEGLEDRSFVAPQGDSDSDSDLLVSDKEYGNDSYWMNTSP